MIELYNPGDSKGVTDYGGLVKTIVSKDKEMGSNLNAGVFSLAAGESLVPDIHPSDEVFYIISGEVTISDHQGQQRIRARAGQIVRIPKSTVHVSTNEGRDDAHIFWAFAEMG